METHSDIINSESRKAKTSENILLFEMIILLGSCCGLSTIGALVVSYLRDPIQTTNFAKAVGGAIGIHFP
jgi:hypothetical protein